MDTQAPWRFCSDPASLSSMGDAALVLRAISHLIHGVRVLQNRMSKNVRKGHCGLQQIRFSGQI